MDDFILRAFLAGLALVLIAGPLGVFIVWRRMAYFGDTLSHSALLGVAMGFLLGVSISLTTLLVCLLIASLMLLVQRQKTLGQDTFLGILAHASLAFGMVALSFTENLRVDLMAYLFGDILAVNQQQLIFIWVVSLITLAILYFIWNRLLFIAIDEELARVEGINVSLIGAIYLFMLALLIAIAMKIVGMLLITALLIIPAATARYFAKTPEHMAIIASFVGLLSLIGGLGISLQWDTPTGPSIIVMATVLFMLGIIKQSTSQRRV
jgi:zinc transport system permease protein